MLPVMLHIQCFQENVILIFLCTLITASNYACALTYSSNVSDVTYSSNVSDVTYSSNDSDVTYSSNVSDVTYSSNVSDETYSSNVSDVTCSSNVSDSTVSSTFVLITEPHQFYYDLIPESFKKYGIFYSLRTLFDYLHREKFHDIPLISYILNVLKDNCGGNFDRTQLRRMRYPFIVVEGSRRTRAHYLSTLLAKEINAKLLLGSPRCLYHLKNKFFKVGELKKIFFAVSMYVTSYNVRRMLEYTPVVLSGYWMQHAAYHIAKAFEESLPPSDSIVYEFPDDLMAPDLVFFINSFEGEETKRYLLRLKENLPVVYSRMRNPNVYTWNSTHDTDSDLEEIVRVTKNELIPRFSNF